MRTASIIGVIICHLDDGGSTHLWNVGLLRDYTALYSRWPQISHRPSSYNLLFEGRSFSRRNRVHGIKFSAFNPEILNADSFNLHYNTYDWSSAKTVPENIERQIRVRIVYFLRALCHAFDPVSPKKDAFVGQASWPSSVKIRELIKIISITMRYTKQNTFNDICNLHSRENWNVVSLVTTPCSPLL
jgi:hypothetical protein